MGAVYDRLKSHFRQLLYVDDDAAAATPRYVAWVPMGQHFLASLLFVSGTGVATFKLFAATDASGTGATEIKSHAGPTVADAAGDTLTLETAAEEVKATLDNATHVSVQVSNDVDTDINSVAYLLEGDINAGRFASEGLTADVIS